jgi:GT2 family glycosyltransferase
MAESSESSAQADPRIAVVMITHDRVHEVLASLRELEALPEGPQIILVDNQSTDGTVEAVGREHPGVEVVRAGGNIGAAARNLGVRRAVSPYVAFSDDDVWWEPGSLRRAADLLDAHPRLAVAAGRVLVGPANRPDPVCDVLARSPLPREPGMPGPSLLGFLAGASVVRRSAFLEAGGFEPRFFVGGEEELLAADLAARGWWLCYTPELIAHHHPSPARDARKRREVMARNALWFAWMRRPWRIAVRETLGTARRRPLKPETWRILASALRGLPWALRNRRRLPDQVERGLRLLEDHD